MIDSQSVKGADTVGRDSRGYDTGKKIDGRKRFIVTDTAGLLITVAVLAASWQDRDGGKTALLGLYLTSPLRHVFADQRFAGRFVDWAATTLKTTIEIVRKLVSSTPPGGGENPGMAHRLPPTCTRLRTPTANL